MPTDPRFDAALYRLARATTRYIGSTKRRAILVGGAAVTIYTDGEISSGDFDLLIDPDTDLDFSAAMAAEGFRREDRSGHLLVGWYHPDHLAYGFQLVSGPLFGGLSDPARVEALALDQGLSIHLIAVEDLIADRLGQQAATRSPSDFQMAKQARLLFRLAGNLDAAYLSKRIRDEQGDETFLTSGA